MTFVRLVMPSDCGHHGCTLLVCSGLLDSCPQARMAAARRAEMASAGREADRRFELARLRDLRGVR